MDPVDIRRCSAQPGPVLNLEVVIEDERWAAIAGIEQAIGEALGAVLARVGGSQTGPVTVNVALLSDAELRALNHRFRGEDKPTNVLSFPAADRRAPGGKPRPLGDIALAFETLDREARDASIPLLDHVRHLTVHGLLHLLGYQHRTDAEAAGMEALETSILGALGVPDPYASAADGQVLAVGQR